MIDQLYFKLMKINVVIQISIGNGVVTKVYGVVIFIKR